MVSKPWAQSATAFFKKKEKKWRLLPLLLVVESKNLS
jgi:hypothetical protein